MRLWQNTRVVGLFTEETDLDQVLQTLQANLKPEPLPRYTHEILEDKVWERVWMDEFKPICFGTRLWICPSWCEPPQSDAVNIKLDPGLAFGTGTHPTTALCLKWLDANPPRGLEVIDYGCGSGILAVAAAMLDAKQVWAIDHDPQAVLATNENAAINQVSQRITAGDATIAPAHKVDLLLANILAQPLIEFAEKFAGMVEPQGQIVLSGILDHQAEEVINAYKNHFDIDPVAQQEEWVRITGKRTP
jgi:ribosomal protein L11 methyltransferase